MPSAEVLQQRLDEAEEALHALQIGAREASISVAGHSVTYTQAKVAELKSYIDDLKAQLGQPTRRRAIGARF